MANRLYVDYEKYLNSNYYGYGVATLFNNKPKALYSQVIFTRGNPCFEALNKSFNILKNNKSLQDFNLIFSNFASSTNGTNDFNNLVSQFGTKNTHLVSIYNHDKLFNNLKSKIISALKNNKSNLKNLAHQETDNNNSIKSNVIKANDSQRINSNLLPYITRTFANSEKILSKISKVSIQLDNQKSNLNNLTKEHFSNNVRKDSQVSSSKKHPNHVSQNENGSENEHQLSQLKIKNKQLTLKLQTTSNEVDIIKHLTNLSNHNKKISLNDIHKWLGKDDSIGLAKSIISNLVKLNYIQKLSSNIYKVNLRIHKNWF